MTKKEDDEDDPLTTEGMDESLNYLDYNEMGDEESVTENTLEETLDENMMIYFQ